MKVRHHGADKSPRDCFFPRESSLFPVDIVDSPFLHLIFRFLSHINYYILCICNIWSLFLRIYSVSVGVYRCNVDPPRGLDLALFFLCNS